MATKFDKQKITEDLYTWGCMCWGGVGGETR